MKEILFTISDDTDEYKIVTKNLDYSAYNAYYISANEVVTEMFKITNILNNEHNISAVFDVE